MEQLPTIPPIHLQPGEEILWTGRPVPRFFDTSSKDLFLFGVLMLGFCAWIWGIIIGFAVREGWWSMLPFIAVISIFMALGLFFLTAPLRLFRKLKHTTYAITDQRAVIFHPQKGVKSHPLAPNLLKERHLRPGGGGDLVFDFEETHQSNDTPVFRAVGFTHLPELQPAEKLLNHLIYGTAPAAPSGADLDSTLERDAREYLPTCLLPGETILWTGRPQPKLFRGQRVLLLATAFWLTIVLLFTFLAVSGTTTNTPADEESFPAWFPFVFLIPFQLAGLFLLIAPFYEYVSRRREVYAVTDKRLILAEPCGDWFRHTSHPLPLSAKRTLTPHKDGTGDITILHRGQNIVLHELPDAATVDAIIGGTQADTLK